MEAYEQNNDVTTSYNNNNLKQNFNVCKNDFYNYQDPICNDDPIRLPKDVDKEYNGYLDAKANNRLKIDDNASLNTPFSVKYILNINQTNHYERNEMWKSNDRDRSNDYDPVYHQNQPYCPDYFSQVSHNIPVHSNVEYWNPEIYHDPKVEEYYNYNPYYHNLYQQPYEQYQDVSIPSSHTVTDVQPKLNGLERESQSQMPTLGRYCVDKSQQPIVQNVPYTKVESLEKFNNLSRKTTKSSVCNGKTDKKTKVQRENREYSFHKHKSTL